MHVERDEIGSQVLKATATSPPCTSSVAVPAVRCGTAALPARTPTGGRGTAVCARRWVQRAKQRRRRAGQPGAEIHDGVSWYSSIKVQCMSHASLIVSVETAPAIVEQLVRSQDESCRKEAARLDRNQPSHHFGSWIEQNL